MSYDREGTSMTMNNGKKDFGQWRRGKEEGYWLPRHWSQQTVHACVRLRLRLMRLGAYPCLSTLGSCYYSHFPVFFSSLIPFSTSSPLLPVDFPLVGGGQNSSGSHEQGKNVFLVEEQQCGRLWRQDSNPGVGSSLEDFRGLHATVRAIFSYILPGTGEIAINSRQSDYL